MPESAARLTIEGVGSPCCTPTPQPVELHLLWARESKNPALWRTLAVLEREAAGRLMLCGIARCETALGQASSDFLR